MTTCAFLGLGIMGYHMAGHLDVAVDELRVWNRSPGKRDKWGKTFNGIVSSSIEGAVAGADFVIMCVGDDGDVYSVFDQVIKYVKPESQYLSGIFIGALNEKDLKSTITECVENGASGVSIFSANGISNSHLEVIKSFQSV